MRATTFVVVNAIEDAGAVLEGCQIFSEYFLAFFGNRQNRPLI